MSEQRCGYGAWRRDRTMPTGIRYVGEGCNREARWLCWVYPRDRDYYSANYLLLCPTHARAYVRLRPNHGDVDRFPSEEYLASVRRLTVAL